MFATAVHRACTTELQLTLPLVPIMRACGAAIGLCFHTTRTLEKAIVRLVSFLPCGATLLSQAYTRDLDDSFCLLSCLDEVRGRVLVCRCRLDQRWSILVTYRRAEATRGNVGRSTLACRTEWRRTPALDSASIGWSRRSSGLGKTWICVKQTHFETWCYFLIQPTVPRCKFMLLCFSHPKLTQGLVSAWQAPQWNLRSEFFFVLSVRSLSYISDLQSCMVSSSTFPIEGTNAFCTGTNV